MEVARQYLEDRAARNWIFVPTSGMPPLPYQLSLGPLDEQSSAIPTRWIPQSIAFVRLGGRGSLNNFPSGVPDDVGTWQTGTDYTFARPQLRQIVPQLHAAPIARRIEDFEAILRFTRSQIAQALGVERATLYQWFRGAQPRARTGERLEQLRQFAAEWSHAGLGSARGAWHLRVPGGEHTLGSLLTQDPLDFDQLRAHIQYAQQAPESMEFVEPKASYGFSADDKSAERRHDREFFPPTFTESK